MSAVYGVWYAAVQEAKDPLFGLHAGLIGISGSEWLPGLAGEHQSPINAAVVCCQAFSALASGTYAGPVP